MHVAEGVVSGTPAGWAVLAAGAAVTLGGTAVGLRKTSYEQLPLVAVFTSAFFVVSLSPLSFGGISCHLVLNGLLGLILGWAAFPALLIALLLQALLFGVGGLTTLGLNTMSMALPAVICFGLFHRAVRSGTPPVAILAGFSAGALGVLLGALIVAGALLLAQREFAWLAGGQLLVHVPLMLLEGLVTVGILGFVRKVRPELLQGPAMLSASLG